MPITIRTKELAAVAKWALPTIDKPHLHMVLFTKGEYVACDGHRLVRVPCEWLGDPFGVDRSHILAAAMAQKELNGERDVTLSPNGTTVTLTIAPSVVITAPRRDPSTYPPIEKVMPKHDGSPSPDGYGFDPRYLADINEVNRAVGGEGQRGVRIVTWGSKLDPILFEGACTENTGGRPVRFVVMPMRMD